MNKESKTELELSGLNGSNPLAFLAAIGTIRCLNIIRPELHYRMGWRISKGAWRPFVRCETVELKRDTLTEMLAEYLAKPPQLSLFEAIGDNLTCDPKQFRKLSTHELEQLLKPSDLDVHIRRIPLDFLAAFGSDATHQPHSKDRSIMQDTSLRTMSGAGHQHFIRFMREIVAATNVGHLDSTLFETWAYDDEGRGLNLRWDPIDDRRYALRWKNPSSDPNMTMRGANRLAIEALPLFKTAPVANSLRTTAFKTVRREGTFMHWPIWEPSINVRSISTLLHHPALTDEATAPTELLSRGVKTVFKSQRITVGKFRNFTPASVVL